jgi:hypothetical protein
MGKKGKYKGKDKWLRIRIRDKGMYNRNGLGEKELVSRQASFCS